MIPNATNTFAVALNSQIVSADSFNIFFHTFVAAIVFGILSAIVYRATRDLWR